MPKPRTKPAPAAQVRSYAAKPTEFSEAAASDSKPIATSRRRASPSTPASTQPMRYAEHASAREPPGRTTTRYSSCSAKPVATAPRSNATSAVYFPLKTKAEYEPDNIAPAVAAKAVERAHHCAAVARRAASTTR